MVRMRINFIAVLVFVAMLPFMAAAQTVPSGSVPQQWSPINPPLQTIENITIEGVQRIDPLTVRSYLGLRTGDPLDPEKLDSALKALYDTGLFTDVRFRQEGSNLVVVVQENPMINRITFEGAKKIEADNLRSEIQLRPRTVFTRSKVQADVARILEIYRRSGRFNATVEPKIINLDQNRVDLVFEIDEGEKTGVRRISFIGNKHFSDSTLRGEIATRESAWYRLFGSDDSYDPDRLNADRELLRRFYLKNGYMDFRIVSAVAELTPGQEEFFITFTIDEGERYKVNKVDVASQIKNIDPKLLDEYLHVEKDDWYDSTAVDKTVEDVTVAVGNMGAPFVDVDPVINQNRKDHTVDIAFQVKEGPRVFVESIDITGNVRTLDSVVRREFRFAEGDALNVSKLRRSKQRIQNLGFFEKADITTEAGSAPDRAKVKVNVAEQSTGELSFGGGYSTSDQLIGDIRFRERNLLGRGQDLKASATLSTRRTEFDVGFTEPYFLDRNLAAGIDLFHITRENQRESSYDDKRTGGALRGRYNINDNLSQEWKYSLRRVDIRDVAADASIFIKSQEGTSTTSMITQTLLYDRRDNRITPSNGYFLRFSSDFAGLGGDNRYIRPEVGAGYYFPLAENWIMGFSGEAGQIIKMGKDIRIVDRFFVGGNNLRGFQTGGIGPRDSLTADALGGNTYATGTAELTFPLGLPDELGVNGALFSDVGYLSNVDDEGPNVTDTGNIRASVGFGIGWRSPFGPIRVDIAAPIVKDTGDKTESFRFSFGTRF